MESNCDVLACGVGWGDWGLRMAATTAGCRALPSGTMKACHRPIGQRRKMTERFLQRCKSASPSADRAAEERESSLRERGARARGPESCTAESIGLWPLQIRTLAGSALSPPLVRRTSRTTTCTCTFASARLSSASTGGLTDHHDKVRLQRARARRCPSSGQEKGRDWAFLASVQAHVPDSRVSVDSVSTGLAELEGPRGRSEIVPMYIVVQSCKYTPPF
jgi:hypothetical protein